MDFDVGQHSHLHVGGKPDSGWDELETGSNHDLCGQCDRDGPHAFELAPRDEIRNPVSGAGACFVRGIGCKCRGGPTGAGGVRVVWHSDLDRWRGHQHSAGDSCTRMETDPSWQCHLLPPVLADQRRGNFEGYRIHTNSPGDQRACAVGVGLLLLGWAYHAAGGFGPMLAVPSRFSSFSDFLKFLIPALNGTVGFWATISLN